LNTLGKARKWCRSMTCHQSPPCQRQWHELCLTYPLLFPLSSLSPSLYCMLSLPHRTQIERWQRHCHPDRTMVCLSQYRYTSGNAYGVCDTDRLPALNLSWSYITLQLATYGVWYWQATNSWLDPSLSYSAVAAFCKE
jgi:hypothetical protein